MPAPAFRETIAIINGNPYVRPPDEVLHTVFKQAGKKTSPIPIKGTINKATFQQSLVRYQGDWRLYVNMVMAKAAQIPFSKSIREIVGQVATFAIEFNPEPPVYKMVAFWQRSLDANPIANSNWVKLPPSRQKEIVRYFSQLKTEEAKIRNVQKAIEVLTGHEGRFMARSWKNGA